MGSIPAPAGAGPACTSHEAFAVGANQVNCFLLEIAAQQLGVTRLGADSVQDLLRL